MFSPLADAVLFGPGPVPPPPLAALEMVPLVSRVAHILSAIVLGGGVFYLYLVAVPGRKELEESGRETLQAATRSKWSLVVIVCTLLLLLSGLYNLAVIMRSYELPRYYHPIFGVKFLLALGVFFLAAILSGKTAAAERFRQQASLWLGVAALGVAIIVVLAGVMKMSEKKPKPEEPSPPESAAANLPR